MPLAELGFCHRLASNPATNLDTVTVLLLGELQQNPGKLGKLSRRKILREWSAVLVERLRDQSPGAASDCNGRKNASQFSVEQDLSVDAAIAVGPLENVPEVPEM